MNKVIAWLMIISFCMVIFNVAFDFKEYINNLDLVFKRMPAFPNWSIDWESFSITNWEPLGQFFKCLYYTIKYFIDLIIWSFDLVLNLFGFRSAIDNKGTLDGNFGGGHGGQAG